MNENAVNTTLVYDEDDYLHVGALIMDYLRYLKRTWFLLLLLLAVAVGGVFLTRSVSFVPRYSATVYYALERTTDTYTDAEVTARVAAGVNTLTASADFRSELLQAADLNSTSASYAFYGEATDSANLFSVTIRCTDADLANTLLQAFEVVYPAWVSKSAGKTVLTVTDEVLSTGEAVNSMPIGKRGIYALIAGFAVWFILATVRVFSVRKIHSEDDMYQVANARCIGILPDVVKKKRDKSTRESLLISNENVDGSYLQAVRSLASRVESSIASDHKQVILLTSTLEQEGKSLLTLNLAMVLRRHGRRVIVVDGDMYNSGISRLLNIAQDQPGLSDYLSGKADFKKIFVQRHGLVILTAGTVRGSEVNVMNMKRLTGMFAAMRKTADVVLVDTPPAGQIGDAVLFSELADSVLYVVRGDYAELRDIRKGIEPFIQSRKLEGYILNRVNSTTYGYGYKYGYGAAYARYRNYGSYSSHYGKYSNYSNYGNYGSYSRHMKEDIEYEPDVEGDSSK